MSSFSRPLCALLVSFGIFAWYRIFSGRKQKLPPGPRGLPILGNVLELRGDLPVWHAFDSLKNQYGPIVYLNFAGQDVVLLNTKEVAAELLDRRASNYSDRPKNIVADYLGGSYTLPLARYGKTWQTLRRASHSVLNIRASADYYPAQTDEAIILAFDLLNQTAPPLRSIQRSAASTVVSMCYGMPPLTSDNPILQTLNNIIHRFTKALYPGAFLVEIFPFLDYVPSLLARWKRDAQDDFKKFTTFFERCFEEGLHGQKASLSANLAEKQAVNGLSNLENVWLPGTLYVAGFETTTNSLGWLLHVLSLNPSIQHKAQQEIDRVVGRSRTPTFADMEHLPYIRAMVKEVLRWQPAVPLGLPHVSLEDDWYEGYFIPKGTICFPNIWSINRSTDTYGLDASEFRPERFLNSNGTFNKNDIIEGGHSAFGFGRRTCVGRHVAGNALFIGVATILWALDVTPNGKTSGAKPEKLQKDTLNVCPKLQCNFVPRFPEIEGILKNMRDDLMHSR